MKLRVPPLELVVKLVHVAPKWNVIVIMLLLCSVSAEEFHEEQSYDGLYNNPIYPRWGLVKTPINRLTVPDFSDSSYLPRASSSDSRQLPEPRDVSNAIFRKMNDQDRILTENQRGLTAFFIMFGQMLVQEITETVAPCRPPEYLSIPTRPDDPEFGGITIPMVRSEYIPGTGRAPGRPREVINEATPFLDLQSVYGLSKAWNDALREFSGGRMTETPGARLPPFNTAGLPFGNPPPPVHHMGQNNFFVPDNRDNFAIGNPIGGENIGVWVIHVILLREHNRRAAILAIENPEWTDNRLYNRARQWNIALYQNVIFNQWLPLFLDRPNPLGDYEGYDINLHPQISPEFTTVAMRFGHTLVPHGFRRKLRGVCGNDTPIRLCNVFFNVREELGRGEDPNTVEPIITGMAAQTTEAADSLIVEDLQSFLFGGVELNRRDLGAMNIQRGRDHGIASYNTLRRSFNLAPIESFEDLPLSEEMENLYGNIENIDAFTGGLLETDSNLGRIGPLFDAIIVEQFKRLREGDRFFFENKLNGLFNSTELAEIRSTTLSDIIKRNMLFDSDFIGDAPAPFVQSGVCFLGPLGTNEVPRCTPAARHSFDQINQVIIYIILVLLTILSLFGVTYFVIKTTNRKVKNNRSSSTSSYSNSTNTIKSQEYLKMFVNRYINSKSKNEKVSELFELFSERSAKKGTLRCTHDSFKSAFKLMLEASEVTYSQEVITKIVDNIFKKYSKSNTEPISITESSSSKGTSHKGGKEITFPEFEHMIIEQEYQLSRNSDTYVSNIKTKQNYSIKNVILSNRLEYAWFFIYVCVVIIIFVERAFVYRFETENTGFRQVTGNGVVVTRGAASVIAFTMALLPLTMSKKLLQWISTTKLGKIIPVDRADYFHKVVGVTFAIFNAIHIIGHTYNFYYISSAHPRDMDIIFPEIYFLSNQIPTFFGFWIFGTTTGLTGLLLVINTFLILPFTTNFVRMNKYQLFWKTHQLYIVLYILTFLHGSAQLIQAPLFWHYSTFSVLVYVLDRVYRKNEEFEISNIVHLPSNVIEVVIIKPKKFTYQAGQWGYLSFGNFFGEKHPFTFTTAPHDKYISFHIRVVGPWTTKLQKDLPSKLYFDGPFGSSFSKIGEYNTLIFIGGGIGATPFSSILKDALFRSELKHNKYDSLGVSNITKMYFFWISRNTVSYEWFGDLLKRLEENSLNLSVYRFITGKLENAGESTDRTDTSIGIDNQRQEYVNYNDIFDFQRILLTLGENQHRKITGGRGLIGGHKYPIYFGRPNWGTILHEIIERGNNTLSSSDKEKTKKSVGVFACGGSNLIRDLRSRCYKLDCDFFNENFF